MNLSQVNDIKIPEGNVVKIVSGDTVLWQKDYSKEYFTIEFNGEIGTITVANAVSWSEDKKTWIEIEADSTITPTSKRVYFKNIGSTWCSSNPDVNVWSAIPAAISVSTSFKALGNVMSLLYGDDFIGKTEFPDKAEATFCGLFSGDTTITDASNLILPAKVLRNKSYARMFDACKALVYPPALSATTSITQHSCRLMFKGCSSLLTAPTFPATYVNAFGYAQMFYGCNKLTGIIELPATSLPTYADWQYGQMFAYTNITGIKLGLLTIEKTSYIANWLEGVTTTGVIYKPKEATYDDSLLNLPSTWTVETY